MSIPTYTIGKTIIYEFNELKNMEIFSTPYKIKLKGYYKTIHKNSFILESHGEKYLLESHIGIGFSLVPTSFKDLIIELENQEEAYILNEEVNINDIIDGYGVLIITKYGIEYNVIHNDKLRFCTDEQLIKHVFGVDYKSTKPKETSGIGTGMSRAFVKPIIHLDPGHYGIVTDPKGELFLAEGSSAISKIKSGEIKILKLKK